MRSFEYCKPTLAKAVPTGPDWIHEVKYDGYRGRVVRNGADVRILSKSGLDWAWRYPFIVETALKMKQQRFIIDGEICVLDVQGISDFNALHSNRHNDEAQLSCGRNGPRRIQKPFRDHKNSGRWLVLPVEPVRVP